MKDTRLSCKICKRNTIGKDEENDGILAYLFIENESQFEKHMELCHPKEYKKIKDSYKN